MSLSTAFWILMILQLISAFVLVFDWSMINDLSDTDNALRGPFAKDMREAYDNLPHSLKLSIDGQKLSKTLNLLNKYPKFQEWRQKFLILLALSTSVTLAFGLVIIFYGVHNLGMYTLFSSSINIILTMLIALDVMISGGLDLNDENVTLSYRLLEHKADSLYQKMHEKLVLDKHYHYEMLTKFQPGTMAPEITREIIDGAKKLVANRLQLRNTYFNLTNDALKKSYSAMVKLETSKSEFQDSLAYLERVTSDKKFIRRLLMHGDFDNTSEQQILRELLKSLNALNASYDKCLEKAKPLMQQAENEWQQSLKDAQEMRLVNGDINNMSYDDKLKFYQKR